MPSAVIRRFSYEPQTCTLFVTFVSGQDYAYDAVPPELIEEFRAAFSKGRFFQTRIRDRFACRRLDVARVGAVRTAPANRLIILDEPENDR